MERMDDIRCSLVLQHRLSDEEVLKLYDKIHTQSIVDKLELALADPSLEEFYERYVNVAGFTDLMKDDKNALDNILMLFILISHGYTSSFSESLVYSALFQTFHLPHMHTRVYTHIHTINAKGEIRGLLMKGVGLLLGEGMRSQGARGPRKITERYFLFLSEAQSSTDRQCIMRLCHLHYELTREQRGQEEALGGYVRGALGGEGEEPPPFLSEWSSLLSPIPSLRSAMCVDFLCELLGEGEEGGGKGSGKEREGLALSLLSLLREMLSPLPLPPHCLHPLSLPRLLRGLAPFLPAPLLPSLLASLLPPLGEGDGDEPLLSLLLLDALLSSSLSPHSPSHPNFSLSTPSLLSFLSLVGERGKGRGGLSPLSLFLSLRILRGLKERGESVGERVSRICSDFLPLSPPSPRGGRFVPLLVPLSLSPPEGQGEIEGEGERGLDLTLLAQRCLSSLSSLSSLSPLSPSYPPSLLWGAWLGVVGVVAHLLPPRGAWLSLQASSSPLSSLSLPSLLALWHQPPRSLLSEFAPLEEEGGRVGGSKGGLPPGGRRGLAMERLLSLPLLSLPLSSLPLPSLPTLPIGPLSPCPSSSCPPAPAPSLSSLPLLFLSSSRVCTQLSSLHYLLRGEGGEGGAGVGRESLGEVAEREAARLLPLPLLEAAGGYVLDHTSLHPVEGVRGLLGGRGGLSLILHYLGRVLRPPSCPPAYPPDGTAWGEVVRSLSELCPPLSSSSLPAPPLPTSPASPTPPLLLRLLSLLPPLAQYLRRSRRGEGESSPLSPPEDLLTLLRPLSLDPAPLLGPTWGREEGKLLALSLLSSFLPPCPLPLPPQQALALLARTLGGQGEGEKEGEREGDGLLSLSVACAIARVVREEGAGAGEGEGGLSPRGAALLWQVNRNLFTEHRPPSLSPSFLPPTLHGPPGTHPLYQHLRGGAARTLSFLFPRLPSTPPLYPSPLSDQLYLSFSSPSPALPPHLSSLHALWALYERTEGPGGYVRGAGLFLKEVLRLSLQREGEGEGGNKAFPNFPPASLSLQFLLALYPLPRKIIAMRILPAPAAPAPASPSCLPASPSPSLSSSSSLPSAPSLLPAPPLSSSPFSLLLEVCSWLLLPPQQLRSPPVCLSLLEREKGEVVEVLLLFARGLCESLRIKQLLIWEWRAEQGGKGEGEWGGLHHIEEVLRIFHACLLSWRGLCLRLLSLSPKGRAGASLERKLKATVQRLEDTVSFMGENALSYHLSLPDDEAAQEEGEGGKGAGDRPPPFLMRRVREYLLQQKHLLEASLDDKQGTKG